LYSNQLNAPKVLILDRSLATTVSLIASFSELQKHGIERIFWLQASNLATSTEWTKVASVIYLTTNNPSAAECVCNHIKATLDSTKANSINLDYHVVLTPERGLAFADFLEESQLLGDVALHSWPVYFLPLEENLLSLNIPSGGFGPTYLDGVPSMIDYSAKAIRSLQRKYGLIGKITAKGDAAKQLADLILHGREQRTTQLADKVSSSTADAASTFDYKYSNVFVGTNIEQLVIIDRSTDLITPLLTQLTYQGLINEFYKISDSGQVELPTSIVNPPTSNDNNESSSNATTVSGSAITSGLKKASLNPATDALFEEIQHANFAVVGPILNRVARQLQIDYEKRHEAKTVSEIKDFVGKLGGLQQVHQSLRFHTNLAENLMTLVQGEEFNKWLEIQQNIVADSLDSSVIHVMIEDLINRGSPLSMVLRLLAIASLCKGGIKEKELQYFKKEIYQTYGYNHILTFNRLEKLGLIFARSPSIPNNFATLRKLLNLIVEPQDESNPRDISFAFSGYAPLSVRLVQCAIDKPSVIKPKRFQPTVTTTAASLASSTGWKEAEDIIKYIPGAAVDQQQRSESYVREGKLRKILTRNTPGHDKTTILVYYLGGITYAEIAALRFVAKKLTSVNVILATSGLISGEKIMDAVFG
jgi:vacuolar protein sorting-associated protein 33A